MIVTIKDTIIRRILVTLVIILAVFLIMLLLFIIGMMIGYGGFGHGHVFDVFRLKTWTHIFDFLR
jgi:hypothetical protein